MAPNPIDFDKVITEFHRLPQTGNVAVIVAVSCVFGLYLLLLLWARKADMQDALKVRICSLTQELMHSAPKDRKGGLPCQKDENARYHF